MAKSAFQIPDLRWSLPAGAAIPRYRFVSVNSDGNAVVANATSAVVGVSQNKTAAGQIAEIQDGLVIVEAAAAIAPGALAISNATGLAAAGTTSGYVVIVGASAAGDLITIKM